MGLLIPFLLLLFPLHFLGTLGVPIFFCSRLHYFLRITFVVFDLPSQASGRHFHFRMEFHYSSPLSRVYLFSCMPFEQLLNAHVFRQFETSPSTARNLSLTSAVNPDDGSTVSQATRKEKRIGCNGRGARADLDLE